MSSPRADLRPWSHLVGPLVLSLAASVIASWAGAAPLVYEPFAYDAGTVLDDIPATGVNLDGSYVAIGTATAQQLTVASPGLDYGSLVGAPAASGHHVSDLLGVTAAGASVRVGEDVVVDPGSAIFWSALFTFDDSANGNHLANITLTDDATGDHIFFGEPAVGVGGIRVEANTVTTGGPVVDGADGPSQTARRSFSWGAT